MSLCLSERHAPVTDACLREKTVVVSARCAFTWGQRTDRERVDVGVHHVPDCVVDEPVSPYDWQGSESFRNDVHGEVSTTVGGAGVPGMKVAVVDDVQLDGPQGRAQAFLEAGCTSSSRSNRHGNTLMKGRTSHDAKTPSVT